MRTLDQRDPPHVVIVGGGFAGLAAARALRRAPVRITLVDRRNYHLFQPLLYQVATAGLSPGDVAWPIRGILSRQANVAVRLGRVTGVDGQARVVRIGERTLFYDYLVLATGARHAYFGNDHWEAVAPGLKKLADATEIRERVLLAFERAEAAPDPVLARDLLTFVVVGGGPTGVEMAGAIAELARHTLRDDFRAIDPRQTRVVLVEGGARLLAAFPEALSAAAKAALEKLGVEVRLSARVTECSAGGVRIGDEAIRAGNVIWAAGVMASPAGKWLGVPVDRAGRVRVQPDLSVEGHPEIFVVGDTAACTDATGRVVPGIAPAAKQMGTHAGRVIAARVAGRSLPPPFRYRHAGNLATIGRSAAVADFGWLRLSGMPAWLLWAVVHVFFLVGWRNRLSVGISWLWSYVTYERGVRIISAAEAAADLPGAVPDPWLEEAA